MYKSVCLDRSVLLSYIVFSLSLVHGGHSKIRTSDRRMLFLKLIHQVYVGWFIVLALKRISNGKIKVEIGKILRTLCERKGVEIIRAEACPNHIHMLVSIPPKYSVSEFMGYLKGKSSLMIFDKFANMKYRYGNRQFWCRRYYVDTVGTNTLKISWKKINSMSN